MAILMMGAGSSGTITIGAGGSWTTAMGGSGSWMTMMRSSAMPIHPNVGTRWFYVRVAAAGLPRIRLHDVRHSAVTAMLHAGVPVKVVSERVGYASTSLTMDGYATALPHMQGEASARMAAVIDGS